MTPALMIIVTIRARDAVGANGKARSGGHGWSRLPPWKRSFRPASDPVAGRLPFLSAVVLAVMFTRASPPALKSP